MGHLANVFVRLFVFWGLLSHHYFLNAVRSSRKNSERTKTSISSTSMMKIIPNKALPLVKPQPPDDEYVNVATSSPEELEDEEIDIETVDKAQCWPPVATHLYSKKTFVKDFRRKSRAPVFQQDCNLDFDYDLENIIKAWGTNKKCIIAMADESSVCLMALRIGQFLEKFGVDRSRAVLYGLTLPQIYQWITSVESIPKRHVRLFKRKLTSAFWHALTSLDAETKQKLSLN